MCGIAGLWSPTPLAEGEAVVGHLARMARALRHRGPDDSGTWSDGTVGLAHTRLAIIDLTPTGRQPMSDERERASIVYNGECYNFLTLRRELEAKGHRFRGGSDTEVILRGYLEWGEGVIQRLRGMFALAIWDRTRRRLLLARDRLGKKPLVYGWHQGRLYFASEAKAILAWPGFPRRADLAAIHDYLTFQAVPAPATAFQGIFRLPPAHYAVVEDGRLRLERYWQAPAATSSLAQPNDAQEQFLSLFDEAVKLRMIADVPLGAFLSGGIDSGAVVASMARAGAGRIKTFTIGFAEDAFDERKEARLVAERYGTDHKEFVVTPDAAALLPTLTWHYGEPFADASAVPSYCVAEIARREVTVALNGDGGDEAFMGYPVYRACRLSGAFDALPLTLRKLIAALARALPFGRSSLATLRRALRFAQELAEPRHRRFGSWVATFADADKRGLYGEGLLREGARVSADRLAPFFVGDAPMEAEAAAADVANYLPDVLLAKVDIATMANSLESRSPLLDHQVVEFALGLPAAARLTGNRTKAFLKDAMRERLPTEILERPKRGFAVPLDPWFRGPLRALLRDTLASDAARARGLFRTEAVERLIASHESGRENHGNRLWSLLMLELWFRAWIDPAEPPARPEAPVLHVA